MKTQTFNHILAHASAQCQQVQLAGGDRTYNTTAMLATAYLSARFNVALALTSADILQLMNLLAMARTVTNPGDAAAYVEQSATAAGAAQMNGVTFPEPEEKPKADAPKTDTPQGNTVAPVEPAPPVEPAKSPSLEDEISKMAEDRSIRDMASKLRPKL